MIRPFFLLPLFLVVVLSPRPVLAQTQWQVDGSAVSTYLGDQLLPAIASDGAGGTIVTWYDTRSGTSDIYAQRIDGSGAAQWAAGGVALTTAAGNQINPTILADGSGGAIVIWRDARDGNYEADLYAQRVDASGAVQWAANGVPVCTAVQWQYYPRMIPDGAGGAIVTWQDYRGGNVPDIYAQRMDASGTMQWTTDGVPLCTATDYQVRPTIVPDGAGGAIVAWYDYRSGVSDIYAQRIDASGAAQWTADGVAVCTAEGSQYYPRIVSDEAGGAILTWHDFRSVAPDIYAQRIDGSGVPQWTTDGVPLCTAADSQTSPRIVPDGAGGAIVTWRDHRSGTNYDIYAQRVSASGAAQWTANGVAVCTAANNLSSQHVPEIVPDGTGGAIVTWDDHRSGTNYDIYAQRIDGMGAAQWTADGLPLCTAPYDQNNPTIVLDGSGEATVTWYDYRNGENYDVYAQRVEGTGGGTGIGDTPASPVFTVLQNVPNPFASATRLEIALPAAGRILIDVYDVSGRRVRTMELPGVEGRQAVPFAALDDHGTPLENGVYFYRVRSGGFTVTRKMIVVR